MDSYLRGVYIYSLMCRSNREYNTIALEFKIITVHKRVLANVWFAQMLFLFSSRHA